MLLAIFSSKKNTDKNNVIPKYIIPNNDNIFIPKLLKKKIPLVGSAQDLVIIFFQLCFLIARPSFIRKLTSYIFE